MTIKLLLGISLPLTLLAQSGPPVVISSIALSSDPATREPLKFSATNSSGKAVAAYVLRCRLRDDVGKAVGQINTTVATSGVVPSMARAPYAPGETWTDRVDRIPQKENGGVPAKAEVDAVFVLFADGSTWGDDKMNQAVTLRGMQRGAAMERMLLKRQLKEGGTAAVERFLQSER